MNMGYIVVPSEKRFLVLLTFLKKNRDKKLAVFFSSWKAVDHFSELLNDLDPSLPISILHENLNQACRTQTLAQFNGSKKSILLCTDVILQNTVLPPLDWIVQYDQPTDPQKYVRLAASLLSKTTEIKNELLFLREEELGFLMYLREAKIPLNEYDMKYNRVANIQSQIEKRISENYALHISAQDAYKHFIRSYASHPQKSIFDVNKLDLV
jgi:ATP-dependent RNA helicase DDX18/HAS1